eukprot:366474-Chlamydomonas_euryale.AAC.34
MDHAGRDAQTTHEQTNGQTDERTEGWIDGCIEGWTCCFLPCIAACAQHQDARSNGPQTLDTGFASMWLVRPSCSPCKHAGMSLCEGDAAHTDCAARVEMHSIQGGICMFFSMRMLGRLHVHVSGSLRGDCGTHAHLQQRARGPRGQLLNAEALTGRHQAGHI